MSEPNASAVIEPRAVLDALLDGNDRFTADQLRYERDIASARKVAAGQRPSALVFSCIDSRVTPEVLFDRDFAQLLVVRTAGHVPDRAAVGSIEFAAAEMRVGLVVVLGHERCGAVKAALDAVEADDRDGGYLIEQLWEPASQALAESPDKERAAPLATRLHVRRTVADLGRRANLDGVLVVGAVYDLDTGKVTLVDED